ncbi:DUF3048 domain-containing protein [Marmoricola sp. Leaf446]|uniref:DUF3048 domain-containing protein n=1 Tax=Marmoricola sp. Leaf446 TaxID=1736379 RepID=UPI00138F00F0|nr:DUF3048 domain-containing protein [Marmoricola sp. Leaf446]
MTPPGRPYAVVPRRRAPLLAGLITAGLVGLAACSPAPAAEKEPASQPVSGGTQLAALWPLTGRSVDERTPDHPVVVAKVDNTRASAPQVGLAQADLVTEELVEGGMTRLAVMFYEDLPSVVGPVRSMRATDIGIVKPTLGVVAASGAAPSTLKRVRKAGITAFDDRNGTGYYRDPARTKPYDLMVKVPALVASLTEEPVVPPSYLPWGSAADFPGGTRARSLEAVFSDEHTTSWRFADGTWVNDNSFAAPGQRFDPDTLLVLRVRQRDAGYLDPAGNRVPETVFTGRGEAMLLHGGELVRGTWSKRTAGSPLRLRTEAGELRVPAGRTWIELVPTDQDGGRVSVGGSGQSG